VEAFALAAPNPARRPYWGKAAWGQPRELADEALWQPYPPPGRMRPFYSGTIDTVIVKIVADDGSIGWGEAKAPVAAGATREIVAGLFAPILVGADPFDFEVIWTALYAAMRLRGHTSGYHLEAISGIDIALWDLVGKATGRPIHKLLGGAFRERVKVYASGVPATRAGPGEPDHQRMMDAVGEIRERGFLGLKMGIGLGFDADLASVVAVRETVGPDFPIFVDAAGNYDAAGAIRLGRELEALGVGFLEAPLPPEHLEGYAEVARHLALPIASDLIVSRYQALEYFRRGALDIVQPDVCRAGGISELRRIAALAEVFGAGFTPHISIGSAIHFAASLQVAASVPGLVQMEYWYGENPLGDSVLHAPALAVSDGHVAVPAGPGLGVDIDEDRLLAHAVSGP
jgi:D-arabinonate dehydratase/D-galactarolactone cycloisomerase